MSQSTKEQIDIGLWNEVQEDLRQLGLRGENEWEIREITEEIARRRGVTPQQVMDGLLQGVQLGDIAISGNTVRFLA